MDSNVPVEETLEALKELVNGQIVAVGLSEIGAAAIKRAHAIFPKILELVDKVNEFAIRRGVTQVQLMLGWIRAHSDTGDYIAIIPTPVWLLSQYGFFIYWSMNEI
ncbi:hypothetical protein EYZ11_005576 [Aspergillus tanneri]|uniref:NADP-dependent oxidoreductase domain-containing protein n=1 Tax=Aspergillus tanneri TaxID=1220188 RepID=A0A4S3JJZ0_9EURO|nr:hypothetical protein EYZ11_005576 [Aspergillus tanneri]